MNVKHAEGTLRGMLAEGGIDLEQPALLETWRVFRTFAEQPIDSESDGILVQSGVYDEDDGERFVFDFLRQVQLPDDDEFLQIHCEFQFSPTPDLRELGVFEQWWFSDEGDSPSTYFDEIEARPEFRAVSMLTPTQGRVFADET